MITDVIEWNDYKSIKIFISDCALVTNQGNMILEIKSIGSGEFCVRD